MRPNYIEFFLLLSRESSKALFIEITVDLKGYPVAIYESGCKMHLLFVEAGMFPVMVHVNVMSTKHVQCVNLYRKVWVQT